MKKLIFKIKKFFGLNKLVIAYDEVTGDFTTEIF